jgi:hypothetical protein
MVEAWVETKALPVMNVDAVPQKRFVKVCLVLFEELF